MQGTHTFQISTKDILFDITLHRNITVLRGDGATYKTFFCKSITAAHMKGTGVHLHSYSDEVYYVTEQEFHIDRLAHYAGHDCILVFDETSPCIFTPEFRKAIEYTGCYFIIITRSDCACFGVSSKEIYEFASDDLIDLNKRVVKLNQLYPEEFYGKMSNQQTILTEDSNAGMQFFSRALANKRVISAHGKNNICTMLQKYPGSIVIADGAAIGFELEDILDVLFQTDSYLIIKESFEYVLLKSGILNFYLPKEIDLDAPSVDSSRYLTWERFYFSLIQEITQGTPYYYKKSSLPSIYTKGKNANIILSVYGLSAPEEHTNIFV